MGAWDKDSRDIEYCPSCGAYIPSKAVRCLSCGAVTERGKKYGEGKYNPRTGTITTNGAGRDIEGNILSAPDEEAIAFSRLMRELSESHRKEAQKLREQQNANTTSVDIDLDDIRQKRFFTVKISGKVRTMYMASPLCSSPYVTFGSRPEETAKLRLDLTMIER